MATPRTITVRHERPEDLGAIHGVNAAAFETDAEARLVDELRASGHLLVSLVAELSGAIVGHIAFSPVSVSGVKGGVGLAPVAVLPDHQRSGIGSQLVREGLARCLELGLGFVVVLGEPGYYKRFGFHPASRWGMTDEFGGGEASQAIELRTGSIPHQAGLVRYAPEFGAFIGDPP